MKIRDFAKLVAAIEGKKKQVNIAQLMETIKVIDQLTEGELYRIIRKAPLKTA